MSGYKSKAQWRLFFANPRLRRHARRKAHETPGGKGVRYPQAADPQARAGDQEYAVSVAELEPIAVYDCNDPHNVYQNLSFEGMQALSEWLKENEVPDADATTHVEVYQDDRPFAVIHQVKLDDQGRVIWSPEAGEVERREPFRHPLKTLPPDV